MSIDPAALAREVLDAHDAWGKTIAGSDECARASDAFTSALRCNGGALARAVIDVQAVVEEFACAVTLDRGLPEWESMCDHFVKKFRAALNGDNK